MPVLSTALQLDVEPKISIWQMQLYAGPWTSLDTTNPKCGLMRTPERDSLKIRILCNHTGKPPKYNTGCYIWSLEMDPQGGCYIRAGAFGALVFPIKNRGCYI
jgi:hypothetical protein